MVHSCPMYLIIAKDQEERRRALEGILKKEEASHLFFNPDQFDSFLQEIETLPFLSKSKAVILEEVDQLDKKELEQLCKYVSKPNPWVVLYLTAASLSPQSKLVKQIGKVIRIKDEKPWEKEKRLTDWAIETAAAAGVVMTLPTAQAFVKAVDSQFLNSELDKLICFAGKRREIVVADIHAISTPMHHETLWQLGEAIFTSQSSLALQIGKALLEDGLSFFPLLASLRTQFHTTLKILTIFQNEGKTGVSQSFPYLRGGLLDKKVTTAREYGFIRLKHGLIHLFETEIKAKNSGIDPELLLEILLIKLTNDTLSTAECIGTC